MRGHGVGSIHNPDDRVGGLGAFSREFLQDALFRFARLGEDLLRGLSALDLNGALG